MGAPPDLIRRRPNQQYEIFMSTFKWLVLIFGIIFCQNFCWADYQDVLVESHLDEDGRETTTFMGGSREDREMAIILSDRPEPADSDLIKYVFRGSGSTVIECRTGATLISFRVEVKGSHVEKTRLTVRLLDTEDRVVDDIARTQGAADSIGSLSVEEGDYRIEITQDGPGDWEVWAIAPEDASFYSSRVKKKSTFLEAD